MDFSLICNIPLVNTGNLSEVVEAVIDGKCKVHTASEMHAAHGNMLEVSWHMHVMQNYKITLQQGSEAVVNM